MQVLVAPMTIHIPSAKAMLVGNLQVCAQNVSMYSIGAYTGEVCAEQLKDFGVMHTIIGHSERRHLLNEADEVVAKKVQKAQE